MDLLTVNIARGDGLDWAGTFLDVRDANQCLLVLLLGVWRWNQVILMGLCRIQMFLVFFLQMSGICCWS